MKKCFKKESRKLAQEWLTLIGSLSKETTTSDGQVLP